MPVNSWKKVCVGSRIAVYYRKDRCYYACTVLEKQGKKFKLEFEDNTIEWKKLAGCPFRWQELSTIKDKEDESSEEEGKDSPYSTTSSSSEYEESSSEEDDDSSNEEGVEIDKEKK